MNPWLSLALVALCGALVFWSALGLIGRLQGGKKKNMPPLDPGPGEGHNLDGPGEGHNLDGPGD